MTCRFKIKAGRLAWLRETFSRKNRHNCNARLFVFLQSLASVSILFAVLRSLISNESETDVQTGGNWVNRSSCSRSYSGEIGNASAFFYRPPYPSVAEKERRSSSSFSDRVITRRNCCSAVDNRSR